MNDSSNTPMLQVVDLKKHFPVHGDSFLGKSTGTLKAVDGVTFSVRQGETFGLVGESGCGKTTVGKTIIDLYHPTSGQIIWQGIDRKSCTKEQLAEIKLRLDSYLQAEGIDVENPVAPPEFLIEVQGIPALPLGDLSLITGE